MRIYARKEFTWKEDKLYLGTEYIGQIVPTLYQIEWADKVKSTDIYNKTRAKENLLNHTLLKLNKSNEDTALE